MDLPKIQYFENVVHERHQEFIESHNHCALCGTVLELIHAIDAETKEIKEEALETT